MNHKRNHIACRIVGMLGLCLTALALGFTAFSHLVYHRSARATAVEWMLRAQKQDFMTDRDKAVAFLEACSREEDQPYSLPAHRYASSVSIETFSTHPVLTFQGSDAPSATVLYLHGGCYVMEITEYQVDFCDTLSAELNASVLAPLYPLAPNHTCVETYEFLEELYLSLLEREGSVTLIGDSAGGGLAAGFCEYLAAQGYPQPARLVLISPWVDATMSGKNYDAYEKADPMLGVKGLIVMGESWAGDLDPGDYRLSPMFGTVDTLPETAIFVGTRELLYPDVTAFYEKLLERQVPVTLYIGEGMNHIYPFYAIPEAITAMRQIVSFLSGA